MDTFYLVVLIKKNAEDGSFNNPIHTQPTTDNTNPLDWAYGKYFACLSTYWNDTTWSYIACYIIRSDGVVIEGKTRDSRTEA